MNKIPLTDYARQNKIDPSTARRRAIDGKYNTAEKFGRIWIIDPEEPHVDHRVTSGKYKNWRKNTPE